MEFGDSSCLIFPSGYERTVERDQVVIIGIVIDKSFFHIHLNPLGSMRGILRIFECPSDMFLGIAQNE